MTSARDIPISEQHAFIDLAKEFQWGEVKRLVNAKPVLVNVRPAMRWSALHQAAFAGSTDAVKFLLGHGAAIDAKTADDKTPVDVAKTPKVRCILNEFARSGSVPTPLRRSASSKSSASEPVTILKVMKAKKAMKSMKVAKKTIAKGKRAKSLVYKGHFKKTGGGLTKDGLTKNKAGKIVSRRMQTQGKKAFANIKAWVDAFLKARVEMGISGFVPVKKGSALYAKTMELYKQ